jgi:Protein of unknown function (DUF1551).
MCKIKRVCWISVIFLAFFLLFSLPQAMSADATGNAPVMVASQEATIPLTANAVTGAAEAECPYKLHIRLAAVALHREGNNRNYRLFDAEHAGAYAEVKARDLDLGWAPGMDASIMLQAHNLGAELRYFGLQSWSESKGSFDEEDFWYAAAYGKYESWLNNAEFNLHWWPCGDRFNFLMGLRWIKLNERLMGREEWECGMCGYDYMRVGVTTRNQLWGGQVGVEGLLCGKRDQGFSIDGGVKVGIFRNSIHNKYDGQYEYDDFFDGSGSGTFSGSSHRSKNTVVSELGINANYAFTKNIALTVGYQLLHLSAAALAGQENSVQSVVYQGGRLGVTIAF